MIELSVHFVKHKTSLLPRGMTVNKYFEVNGQVTVNHSYIVKKMDIIKIFVNSCFISQKEKNQNHSAIHQGLVASLCSYVTLILLLLSLGCF